jgi:hypothetical protein
MNGWSMQDAGQAEEEGRREEGGKAMNDHLTQYELEVLHWHKGRPQSASGSEDRREAQHILTDLCYLVRSDEGTFSITSKGLRRLAEQ